MDYAELSAAYVLGALSPIERAEIGQRRLYDLALNDAILAEEARLSEMGGLPAAMADDNKLWGRIAGALAAEQSALSNVSLNVFSDGNWEQHTDLIDSKILWSDKAMLLRCGPGAVEPEHPQEQGEDEHMIVIAGDVMMGGRTFNVGDYLKIEGGTMHAEMRSRGGCILLSQYLPTSQN